MEVTPADTAKAYACSAIGYVHVGALVSSLVAFVCNESASWCDGRGQCAVPIYGSTYIYFSAVTLAAFLISGVLYVLHCTKMYDKLRCNSKRKLLGEIYCMGGICFFLVFGNLFMISRTANKMLYMVSTVFGCLAMSIFGVQLVLVFLRNYSLLIVEGSEDDSTDDKESNNLECSAEEFTIQTTAIKRFNIGGHSPENMPLKKSSNQTSPYVAEPDSFDSDASSQDN